jgi:hypothetical protein
MNKKGLNCTVNVLSNREDIFLCHAMHVADGHALIKTIFSGIEPLDFAEMFYGLPL